ncbi:DUF1062 domain-containing protein [Roseibium sp. HPY-6]|uniref:DUF1062 domain-containing protein n=1 Tax=Roseibium sp. HPY-6 TaxID=3229852 RepID=UPI00338F0C93
MSSHFQFEWTVLIAETPHLLRPCGRCGSIQAFASTGKFRLNANGNRLDAWLIYACLACGRRWNRAFLQRQATGSISQPLLLSLQENDATLAREVAFVPPDKSAGAVLGGNPDFIIEKRVLAHRGLECGSAHLTIKNPSGVSVRLDRLLAAGLTLSRSQVQSLVAAGAIVLAHGSRKGLKQAVQQQVAITLLPAAHQSIPGLYCRLSGEILSS